MISSNRLLDLCLACTLSLSIICCGGKRTNRIYLESPYDATGEAYVDDMGYDDDDYVVVPYTMSAGVMSIPVKVNGLDLDMIFDTGAAATFITRLEAALMYKQGKLRDEDIIDIQEFVMADGNIAEGMVINLRRIEIGNAELNNVQAVVTENADASLLLGQTAMRRFRGHMIDNENGVVIFVK